jgi:predicted RNase H-like nuclease (RuvC/YqgF family)
MWYVIIGAAGLLLGLGLMVWALRERSARHKAEREVSDLEDTIKWKDQAIKNWRDGFDRLDVECKRQDTFIMTLKSEIEELQTRLVAAKDPETIKDLLDEELGKEEL